MESINKIFNALRGISSMLLLFVLLYAYANLPQNVGLSSDHVGSPANFVTRNTFFFGCLLLFVTINASFFIWIQFLKKSITSKSQLIPIWWNGLNTLLNIFFVVSLTFISAFNSLEKVNLANFGLLILVILVVIAFWLLGRIFIFFTGNWVR